MPQITSWCLAFLQALKSGQKGAHGALLAAGNGVVLAVLLCLPNAYDSQASLLPAIDAWSSGSAFGGLAAAVGIASNSGSDPGYQEILTSTWVAEKLVNRTYSYPLAGGAAGYRGNLLDYFGVSDLEQARTKLKKALTVNKDPQSGTLTITMRSRYPQLSQQVVREALRLMQEFIHFSLQGKGKARLTLSQQLVEDADTQYQAAERALTDFAKLNRRYPDSSSPEIRLTGRRLENELALAEARQKSAILQCDHAKVDALNDVPTCTILDEGNLAVRCSWPPRTRIFLGLLAVSALLDAAFLILRHQQQPG